MNDLLPREKIPRRFLYALVLGELAATILLFYAFTKAFS